MKSQLVSDLSPITELKRNRIFSVNGDVLGKALVRHALRCVSKNRMIAIIRQGKTNSEGLGVLNPHGSIDSTNLCVAYGELDVGCS